MEHIWRISWRKRVGTGVLNASLFPAWSHLGFHWMGNYHNIASMLTESAHAKLATPMYIHKSQLKGEDDRKQLLDEGGNTLRAFPHYKPQTNFPHPWEGGWWRVRDIVEQQKISAWGLLDMAARNKDTVLRNAYLKAKRQTALGASGTPVAYLIRPDQHDPLTVLTMINKPAGSRDRHPKSHPSLYDQRLKLSRGDLLHSSQSAEDGGY